MLKSAVLALTAAVSLSACVGSQPYVSRLSPAELEQNAEAVNRAERAERRAEDREEMMNAADAVRRAKQGRRVYILR